MKKKATVADQFRDLFASPTERKANIRSGGLEIPISFVPALKPSSKVIIKFHGAVNRQARTPPIFLAPDQYLHENWHQISISDPLLAVHSELKIGWFCGDARVNLQNVLQAVLREALGVLDCDLRVYFGASGGGFAALLYSALDAHSVALALNPQTIINNYYVSATRNYIANCWPGAKSLVDIVGDRIFDLRSIYNKAPGNTAIVLQNNSDLHHLHRHVTPLITAIGARCNHDSAIDFIPIVSFWGKMGHQSVPPEIYHGWLDAIASAQDTSGGAILKARAEQRGGKDVGAPKDKAGEYDTSFAPDDIVLADSIANWTS